MAKSRNQETLDYLKEIVGEYNFNAMLIALAGRRVTFPKYFSWIDKEERNTAICNDYYEGMDINDIADKYELSESQVYKIVEGQH